MRRVAVVLVVVVLTGIAWLLWGSSGEPSVDDLAGVYRFAPTPGLGRSSQGTEARLINETYELRLNPDGSYASSLSERVSSARGWDVGSWRGRWEIDGSRVILIRDDPMKPRPTVLLIRGDTLVFEAIERIMHRPPVIEGALDVGTLRKQ